MHLTPTVVPTWFTVYLVIIPTPILRYHPCPAPNQFPITSTPFTILPT